MFDGDRFAACLGARALFIEQEFTACVIVPVLAQNTGGLQREGNLAIQILMQTVVIARLVAQQQWRWADLLMLVTDR